MNERIKELLVQCTDQTMTKPWPLVDTEKFAELIVRECISQNKNAIQTLKDSPEDIPGWVIMMNLAQVTCKNQILEHFGVEE